jgi:hypothetical protein
MASLNTLSSLVATVSAFASRGLFTGGEDPPRFAQRGFPYDL